VIQELDFMVHEGSKKEDKLEALKKELDKIQFLNLNSPERYLKIEGNEQSMARSK
jgi:hypothetical protein